MFVKKEIKTKKLHGFYLKKSEKTKFGGKGEGGVFRDKSTGKDYLVKRISCPGWELPQKKAMNWRSWDEILAARFLKAAGVLVPNMFAVEDEQGLIYVASSKLPGVKNCLKDTFQTLPQASRDLVLASHLMHCWLGNRDLVNNTGENFVVDTDNRIFNVDLGAALFSGFRSVVQGQDDVNFNENSIAPFLLDSTNKRFGIFKTRGGSDTPALNIKSVKHFFSELFQSEQSERKYLLQGALMIAQFGDQDIEDLVNSTGHTAEDKNIRINVLKARKVKILEYVQNKYGINALQEEQIALNLQRIFHKYGIFNKYEKKGGGSDAIVSFTSQYTNALKPNVKINLDGTIIIQVDKQPYPRIFPILQRLAGENAIDNTPNVKITMPIDEFVAALQIDVIENSLQIFFSSFGYLSSVKDEFHRYAYKGDGFDGFRPRVNVRNDTTTAIALPSEADPQHIIQHLCEQFKIAPSNMEIEESVLLIKGISLSQLASYLMKNTGVRKTAVVSEDQQGKILAGKLDPVKKGFSGFATAGGNSTYPYNPSRAAREEGAEEFGHSIKIDAPLIPIGSTLPNKKKNIFLVQPGGTALIADSHIDYKEFQDQSIKYYNFSEFRASYIKDKTKFDRTSVDLYLRHYQRELQKSLNELGIDNVLVHISKKPQSLGKIILKPSIESYNFSSGQVRPMNNKCKKLMEELLGKGKFQCVVKQSQQGNNKKALVVSRECLVLHDQINPAQFHQRLTAKILEVQAGVKPKTFDKHVLEVDRQTNDLETLRTTLIEKVDNYLTWRTNKDLDDGRGYELGFFSKVRHYSAFGQNRAEQLRKKLIEGKTPEVLIVHLKEHFDNYSTLHNHSLDTYLLEGILEQKTLLHFGDDFNLRDTNDRIKLRDQIKSYKLDNTAHDQMLYT
ncbi:TPA: hypothetical protein ACTUT5_000013 [Legionella anisa]|uniref:hypothetical protein n=1 Tax=Legionella anisa TaxID=28082 RepID=UPI00197ECF0C|nr:hypothetical protein [Legionella anisa]MBN5935216.1 hypothetical protein [Legionella anisa]